MIRDLFKVDFGSDKLAIAKAFFNSIYNFYFSESLERLVNFKSLAFEFHGCSFPEDVDFDEEPFDGVKFRFKDEEIIVDVETYKSLVHQAAEQYILYRPEKRDEILLLLRQLDHKKWECN